MKHPSQSNRKRVRAILRAHGRTTSGATHDGASLYSSGVSANGNLDLKKVDACYVPVFLGTQAPAARFDR